MAAACLVASCATTAPREPKPVPSPLTHKPFETPAQEPDTQTLRLPVPGFLSAVLVLPATREPRPLLVVAHGAGDKPEWQCEWWSAALGARAVVLCLRGSAMYPRDPRTGFYFRDHHALGREIDASLAAVQTHRERIAPGPPVFAGFSQGAIMGALVAQAKAPLFSRLILIEGGYDEWNVASGRSVARAPDARVLFACGQEYCASRARRSMGWLARAGVNVRLEHAPRAGHTYAREVGERVIAALSWVVEGDARWRLPVTSSRR